MAMTYMIPVAERVKVQKMLDRVERKARIYGCDFKAEFGVTHAVERVYKDTDPVTGGYVTVAKELVEVVDLTIDCDIVRKGEYVVVAKLDHMEGGNLVKAFGVDALPVWGEVKARCEHCGSNHGLRHTFIVRGADGDHQVGSTCLRDYCGIDPQLIGIYNNLQDVLLDDDPQTYDFHSHGAAPVYSVVEALALAIRIVKEHGYIKSGEPGANRDVLAKYFVSRRATDEEMAAGQALADAIREYDGDDNILWNVRTLVKTGYCSDCNGYLAYAPVAWERHLEKVKEEEAKAARRAAEAAASHFVGSVGERITVDASNVKLLASWENGFGGDTHLYRIVDVDGNVYVWYASSMLKDNVARIKGTVKAHTERDGVCQTVLTRCKAVV